jgi:hypothetical protein
MVRTTFVLLASAAIAAAAAAGAQPGAGPPAPPCPCWEHMAGGMMGTHRPGGAMGGAGHAGGHMGDMSQASEAQLRAALQRHQDCIARIQAELQRRQPPPR